MPVGKRTAVKFILLLSGFMCSPVLAFDAELHRTWDASTPFKAEVYTMTEETEPLMDCALQYYYFIPSPTHSWFWAYSGWEYGDIVGACFRVGDEGTDEYHQCDPIYCSRLERIRVLDFAGYGTVYPGLFTVLFDVYCADETLEPLSHLWCSGPRELGFGWNHIVVDPAVDISACYESEYMFPRVVVTMTMIGSYGVYPRLGFDNVSTPFDLGHEMHDSGCLPAVYPRSGFGGSEPRVHSGYVGTQPFENWPPVPLPDGKHLVDPGGATWFGYAEAAWRIYLKCAGP